MVLTRNVCVTVTEDRFNINAFLEAYARPFVFLYPIPMFFLLLLFVCTQVCDVRVSKILV